MHLLGVTEVVASAGHHLLMTGPPGAGKTMQAREWDLQTRREGGTPPMGQMAAPIGKRRGHFGAISGVPALRFSWSAGRHNKPVPRRCAGRDYRLSGSIEHNLRNIRW